jgi:hypothetical protein
MPSNHETFFDHQTFAVIGHSALRPFPKLTYRGLKRRGKTVFPVDASTREVDGDATYPDLGELPQPAEAAILELPREETAAWIEKLAEAGIRDVWLHMNTDTPEALEAARRANLNVCHGTCAVQYVDSGFPHNVHKLIRKVLRRY